MMPYHHDVWSSWCHIIIASESYHDNMIIIASNSDTTIILSHHVISRHSRSHITSYHILSSCHGNCNHCLHRHHHPPHHIIAIYLSYLLSISIPYHYHFIIQSGSRFSISDRPAWCIMLQLFQKNSRGSLVSGSSSNQVWISQIQHSSSAKNINHVNDVDGGKFINLLIVLCV